MTALFVPSCEQPHSLEGPPRCRKVARQTGGPPRGRAGTGARPRQPGRDTTQGIVSMRIRAGSRLLAGSGRQGRGGRRAAARAALTAACGGRRARRTPRTSGVGRGAHREAHPGAADLHRRPARPGAARGQQEPAARRRAEGRPGGVPAGRGPVEQPARSTRGRSTRARMLTDTADRTRTPRRSAHVVASYKKRRGAARCWTTSPPRVKTCHVVHVAPGTASPHTSQVHARRRRPRPRRPAGHVHHRRHRQGRGGHRAGHRGQGRRHHRGVRVACAPTTRSATLRAAIPLKQAAKLRAGGEVTGCDRAAGPGWRSYPQARRPARSPGPRATPPRLCASARRSRGQPP